MTSPINTPQLMSDEGLYNHLDLSYPELSEKERLELAAFINSQKLAWADYVKQERTKKAQSICGCPMCEHHSEAYRLNTQLPNQLKGDE